MKLKQGDIFWDGVDLRVICSVNYYVKLVHYAFKPNKNELDGKHFQHASHITFFDEKFLDNAGRKISKKVALKILKLKGE